MRKKGWDLFLILVVITSILTGCKKEGASVQVIYSNKIPLEKEVFEEQVLNGQALRQHGLIHRIKRRNAPNPLFIPTYDGGNEICHTGLVAFDKPWNSHRYWMGATPYTDGNDFIENPCIYYSDDLIRWEGIKANPLAKVSKKDEHLSDVALFYNDSEKTLECWWRWRYKPTFEVKIYRRTSKDGVRWTPSELLITTKPETFGAMAAPTVIHENGLYKVYVTDMEGNMTYFTGKDAAKLKRVTNINITYDNKLYDDYWPWHQTVKKIKDTYYMVFSAYPGEKRSDNVHKLFYSESTDGLMWKPAKLILEANKDSWDSKMIYQASFDYIDNQFYLYYSGFWIKEDKTKQKWRLGLLSGKNLDDLYPYEYNQVVSNIK